MQISFNKRSEYTEITLKNKCGLEIRLCSLGAAIREIKVPDRYGAAKTVTLCPVKEEEYATCYHGKTIGRTAGRIKGASFTLGEKSATLEKNNFGEDNLHGGLSGLHMAKFGCEVKQGAQYFDIIFKYLSPDGEGGYFGNVDLKVVYRVYDGENTFRIIYEGKPDERTLLNLTNHVYFNLGGDLEENVREQTLYINAPEFGRLNERLIVEEIVPVTREMDFNIPRKVGEFVDSEVVQKVTKGYDHPYFLGTNGLDDLACSLQSERSGVRLEVRTTYPCVVFYSDGQADRSAEVFPEKYDEPCLGACLECQYHPDGIHQNPENCGICAPEQPYFEEIEYRFTTLLSKK